MKDIELGFPQKIVQTIHLFTIAKATYPMRSASHEFVFRSH
jgi:hypothetical protein